MFAQDNPALNPQILRSLVADLDNYVHAAAQQGAPAHQVERELWQRVLQLGHQALGQFFALQGTGDLGPTVELPNGQTLQRLDDVHPRNYHQTLSSA